MLESQVLLIDYRLTLNKCKILIVARTYISVHIYVFNNIGIFTNSLYLRTQKKIYMKKRKIKKIGFSAYIMTVRRGLSNNNLRRNEWCRFWKQMYLVVNFSLLAEGNFVDALVDRIRVAWLSKVISATTSRIRKFVNATTRNVDQLEALTQLANTTDNYI